MIKWLSLLIAVLALGLVAYSFVDRQFKLSNIQGNWPNIENIQKFSKPHFSLQEAASQPYRYLDRGKQSFVFLSQDERYVLKFFDNRCLRSGKIPFLISISKKRCKKKLDRLFKGYYTASVLDPEHGGLLFMQLMPDASHQLPIKVTDRFGMKHEINLAEIPFVMQLKATPLRELISSLLDEGKVDEAKKRLHQIFKMYLKGYQKGMMDMDHNFMYNTGFVGDQPIRIDLGRLKESKAYKDPKVYSVDLEKIFIKRLGDWLERHFPKYHDEILQDMKILLSQLQML